MANWGKALSGAISGAAGGETIGSFFGPGVGTAIGAVGGGLVGGLSGLFSGKDKAAKQAQALQGQGTGIPQAKIPGYESGSIQQYTPQQMQLHQQQFANVGPDSYLGRLAAGDQSQFAEIEAPAKQQFNELQGGLASRFSGMGTGARRSSGFQNASTSAASQFAQQLQANRMDIRNNAIYGLQDMSNQLLNQRPYEQYILPEQQSGWGNFASSAAGGLMGGAGLLGGLWGAKKLGIL